MACDACGKMAGDLTGLSDHMLRFLPLKYSKCRICYDCARKLDAKLDMERNLAWQKAALLLVDMGKARPTTGPDKGRNV